MKEALLIWVCVTEATNQTRWTYCFCHCAQRPRHSNVKNGKVLYEESIIQRKTQKKMTRGLHTKEPIETTVLVTKTTTKDQKVFFVCG